MKTIFITGTGTDVGKTITSAIVTEALQADYFKPIQAGDLDQSDTYKVQQLVSNPTSTFHANAFQLSRPMSPHAAAAIDGINIKADKVKRPQTNNHLVIEGAGGLLVPINNKETIADLIQTSDKVVVVSRHYLGSINHTLLTIEAIRNKGKEVAGVIFSGKETPSTENIIQEMAKVPIIGRIEEEPYFDKQVIKEYAGLFAKKLNAL